MAGKKKMTFEENLNKLEEIVSLLESGEASLDDIMENYKEGMKLSKLCMDELTRVEKEMDVLIKQQNGSFEEEELRIERD